MRCGNKRLIRALGNTGDSVTLSGAGKGRKHSLGGLRRAEARGRIAVIMAVPESTSQSIRNILWLSASGLRPRDLANALGDAGEVVQASDVAAAISALRAREFDLIVTDRAALLPLAQAASGVLSKSVLDHLGQGICVLDASGRTIYANTVLASYPLDVRHAVERSCQQALTDLRRADGEQLRSLRYSIRAGSEYAFDITATPLDHGPEQVEGLVALVTDASSMRRLQDKMAAIDRVGGELVGLSADVTAKMSMDERLQLLEEKIVRYSRELLNFDHFNLRVLDKPTKRLDVLLAYGMSEEAKSRELFAEPTNNGISGYVAATGRAYICGDVLNDPLYLPALDLARSSLTVPLRVADQVVGVFNVESERANAFTEEDRRFVEMFAAHIAGALQILRLLVVERFAAHKEVAADVDAELATPLNEIVSEVEKLLAEQVADARMTERLKGILRQVERVRDAVHSVTEPAGVTGLVAENTPRDPVISGKRILVADDEDIIRETIANVLTKKGAVTIIAQDGNRAVELIRTQRFDLILSDIRMPTRNGYEVFSAARESNGSTPVILITGFGYDPHHSIVRASKEGLAGVLFKPFKVEHLLEEVRTALGRARAGQ